mgnify:CR=1 FL=1
MSYEALKFQFTHPSGVRPEGDTRRYLLEEFQFTHPSGVRLTAPS